MKELEGSGIRKNVLITNGICFYGRIKWAKRRTLTSSVISLPTEWWNPHVAGETSPPDGLHLCGQKGNRIPEPCRPPSTPSPTTLTTLASPCLVSSRMNHPGVSCLSLPAHPSVPQDSDACKALYTPFSDLISLTQLKFSSHTVGERIGGLWD